MNYLKKHAGAIVITAIVIAALVHFAKKSSYPGSNFVTSVF